MVARKNNNVVFRHGCNNLSDGHCSKKGPSCVTKHENESKTRWEAGGPTEKVRVMTLNNRRITERLGKPRQKQARDSDRSEREFARLEVSTRVYSKITVLMCFGKNFAAGR